MQHMFQEAYHQNALVQFSEQRFSKFCGSTCCPDCARKKRHFPNAEKSQEKFRICEKCCSKFYIKKLRVKFMQEHEAKMITLKQFEDTLAKLNDEEIKIRKNFEDKTHAVLAKEKENEKKIETLQPPKEKLKRLLEREQKELKALTDQNNKLEEEYKKRAAERKTLKENTKELKNRYKAADAKRNTLIKDMNFLKGCIMENEAKILEIEKKQEEERLKHESETENLRTSLREKEREIHEEKKARKMQKKAAKEKEKLPNPMVENLPAPTVGDLKESLLDIQGQDEPDTEVVDETKKSTKKAKKKSTFLCCQKWFKLFDTSYDIQSGQIKQYNILAYFQSDFEKEMKGDYKVGNYLIEELQWDLKDSAEVCQAIKQTRFDRKKNGVEPQKEKGWINHWIPK
eukprot:TRINITY_DN651_c0_g2_i1.p7 TRINITY_DN651_c0_g2~~TRINITY_DN651_c0_g2_i1.p7  ORF type:complete len:400 (-),score=77.49 TRINITY_DN651_c0_g2_i1:5862-7061(-)